MGIDGGALPFNAFLTLVLALLAVAAGVFVYRWGYIRSRAALVAIGLVIAVLVVWEMSPGVAPSS